MSSTVRSTHPPPRSIPPTASGVRGRYMQTFLQRVDQLPEVDRNRIRGALGEAACAAIEQAHALTWLPFDYNLSLTRAVGQTLGPRRTDLFFREVMLDAFQSPLLKTLVDSVVRLLGTDTGVFLGWVSKAFELMFKNVGSWEVVERDSESASLQVTGLPPEALDDTIWLASVASSLSSLFELAKVQGATTMRTVDRERAQVIYRLRWATD